MRPQIEERFDPLEKRDVGTKHAFPVGTDEYLVCKINKYVIPIMGGGAALLILSMYSFLEVTWNSMETFVFLVCCLVLVFYTVYAFTMPKKEQILNRKAGTITFTGFLWADNITMRFDDVRLTQAGGMSGTSPGPIRLAVERPESLGVPSHFNMLAGDVYKDRSFLTWYMDKNRPLPPGSAFDPYRQQDFERRKAEGFPPPLYPSTVPTPEATQAQQDEREQYWKEKKYRAGNSYVVRGIVPGPKHEGPWPW